MTGVSIKAHAAAASPVAVGAGMAGTKPGRGDGPGPGWPRWLAVAIVMLIAPQVFDSGFAITLLSQMGVMIVFCLSYNMLLGQAGMLSFGHAVYSGLGAYCAIHAMNAMTQSAPWLPVALIPLVGGLAGAGFGVLLGFVTTRKAGTTFAMITLGIGELVFAVSLMFPRFFGGEGGITTDRVIGQPLLGISFGPAIEVYYLIAAWCLMSTLAMYAFTFTPLGRIANAVRDNPERAEFIGYDPQRVRYLVLIASTFFAGISGALAAISVEIVSAENLSAVRSGGVLLATFIGGSMFFAGPIIGAIVFVLFAVALSDVTRAWQLYLGAFFVLLVLFAPGGLASLIPMNWRVIRQRMRGRMIWHYLAVGVAGLALLGGTVLIVELAYHTLLERSDDSRLRVFGIELDSDSASTWWVWFAGWVGGGLVFRWTLRRLLARCSDVQAPCPRCR